MSLTYAQYKTQMALLLGVSSESEANYVAILPSMISYAEQRMYSDFNLIAVITEGETLMVAGTRTVQVPSSIAIVQSAYIITPATATAPAGTRNPLQRVSLEFLNFVWPTALSLGVPTYFAMQTETQAVVSPTPDGAYRFNAIGPIRPTPLSASNTTTYLTLYLDPLFTAASMVFGAGYQRDFGAQADDPKMAMSWEAQYQTLKATANMEELQRKAQAFSWQSLPPVQEAKVSRT